MVTGAVYITRDIINSFLRLSRQTQPQNSAITKKDKAVELSSIPTILPLYIEYVKKLRTI